MRNILSRGRAPEELLDSIPQGLRGEEQKGGEQEAVEEKQNVKRNFMKGIANGRGRCLTGGTYQVQYASYQKAEARRCWNKI